MSDTSGMMRLNYNDLLKGLVTAVLGAVVVIVAGVFAQPNFDVFHADWALIFQQAVNAALAAGSAYLLKNLFTNSEGKVFGKI